MKVKVFFGALVLVVSISCAPAPTPTPTRVPPTATVAPTATAVPPTATPVPPATPLPPTATPLSGPRPGRWVGIKPQKVGFIVVSGKALSAITEFYLEFTNGRDICTIEQATWGGRAIPAINGMWFNRRVGTPGQPLETMKIVEEVTGTFGTDGISASGTWKGSRCAGRGYNPDSVFQGEWAAKWVDE